MIFAYPAREHKQNRPLNATGNSAGELGATPFRGGGRSGRCGVAGDPGVQTCFPRKTRSFTGQYPSPTVRLARSALTACDGGGRACCGRRGEHLRLRCSRVEFWCVDNEARRMLHQQVTYVSTKILARLVATPPSAFQTGYGPPRIVAEMTSRRSVLSMERRWTRASQMVGAGRMQ